MTVRRRNTTPPPRTAEQDRRRDEIVDAARSVLTISLTLGATPCVAFLVAAELAYALEEPADRPRRWPTR